MATITTSQDSVRDKIVSAKYVLLSKLPFIGAVSYQVPVVTKSSSDMRGEIAYTNGLEITLNEDYFQKRSFEEFVAIIAHEIGHIVFKSMTRRGNRNHILWNIATDFVINNMLDTATSGTNYFKFPDTDINGNQLKICLDHKYDNMTAEAVYDALRKEYDRQKASMVPSLPSEKDVTKSGDGYGKRGSKGTKTKGKKPQKGGGNSAEEEGVAGGYQSFDPSTGISNEGVRESGDWSEMEERSSQLEEKISEILSKALITAREYMRNRDYGKHAGCLMEAVETSLSQQIDWRKLLHRSLRTMGFERPDYSRPSRRTLVNLYTGISKFYFPKLRGNKPGDIFICIDTSGSVDSKSLAIFLGEINNCLRGMPGCTVYLYTCDTHLELVGKYTQQLPKTVNISGRGGTSFEPPFIEALKICKHNPNLGTFVYFTDGACEYPRYKNGELPFRTLWCFDNHTVDDAPFGKSLRITV